MIRISPQRLSRLKLVAYTAGLVLAAAALAALITFFISRLAMLGHNTYSVDKVGDYMFGLFWGLGISVLLLILPVTLEERKLLMIFWGIRCAVTLFAMLFYEEHYTIDSYGYHWTSIQLSYDWTLPGFGHGTDNTDALTYLMNHYLPIMDSYHALKVLYSFIGFLGCYFTYLAFSMLLGRADRWLMTLIFAFPSMIFWSSTLGKDPINLLGMALYAYGTIGLTKQQRLGYAVPLVAGIYLAAFFRSWSLIIMIVPLVVVVVGGIKHVPSKIVALSAVAVGMLLAFRMFAQQFGVESARDIVSTTQSVSHSWNNGGSAKNVPTFTGFKSMLTFAPFGMFTALFRPLPFEVMNPFGLLAGAENVFLLAYVVRAVRAVQRRRVRLRVPQVSWALALIFVWSFIYAFVSIQNLGAAIRFRLQILPILLSLMYCLCDERWADELEGAAFGAAPVERLTDRSSSERPG